MVMRDTIDERQLFLGLPRAVRLKLQSGSVLNADERALLARGYRTPGDGLEDFAEQLAAVRGLQERDIENLYRAHVIAAQFAAEKIVTHMREHTGEKLLVFARRRELTGDCGLACIRFAKAGSTPDHLGPGTRAHSAAPLSEYRGAIIALAGSRS